MKRRHFLAGSAAVSTAALGGLVYRGFNREFADPRAHPEALLDTPTGRRMVWKNWSEYLHSYPASRAKPRDEQALAELLKTATGPIRPVGAGHSFTPLVPTDGTLVSLRHFNGLISHTADTARVYAGTKLGQIGGLLDPIGQMLPNMPDVDVQSLAGAMATATHGTGAGLGAMHSYIEGLRLVTPRGDVLECNAQQNSDVFQAAKVSLGSLGVITEYTLKNIPRQNMRRRAWMQPLEELLEQFDELAANNYSFEMYFIPYLEQGLAITINPTDDPVSPRTEDPDNDAVGDLQLARNMLDWWPWLRRTIANSLSGDYEPQESVDNWYNAFPSDRAVRFNEMEYHMPREHLLDTVRQVKATIEAEHPETFFPCEVRVVKEDDAWLSPFDHGQSGSGSGGSGSIAVHRYYQEDPMPLFNTIEPLYKKVHGRPHWGKMHTLGAADFAERYPHWQDFVELRAELDPENKMLNAHLRQVFGLG